MSKIPEARSPRDRTPLQPRDPAQAPPLSNLPQARRENNSQPLQSRHGAPQGTAYTRLPQHRHADNELMEIRRREAMRVRPPLAHLRSQLAPAPLVLLGYLLAIAGGIAPLVAKTNWQYATHLKWGGVAGGGGALLVALFIALKKPRSRHHAAFIGIVALLVVVLGILQLLPHPNAT
jgi:hypothetical protein